MSAKTTFLAILAVVCFAAAYRFGSHGIRLHDNRCVGLAVVALAAGIILLWIAFRNWRTKHERPG
jgi:hypothetical protein